MHLEGNDLKSAAATLDTMQKHLQTGYVLARAVQLAVRQRNHKAACEAFRQVCVTECASPWPVECGRGFHGQRRLECRCRRDPARCGRARWRTSRGRQPLGTMVRRRGQSGFRTVDRRRSEKGLRADNAAYAYLDALVKARKDRAFDRFVGDNRQWLRESVFTWGAVGYGMAALRRYRQLTAWMADWRKQADAQPWMLVNAAEGFWGTGKDKEAAEICAHALALAESPAHNMHRILMAGLAVMRNDLSTARNHMQRVQAKNLHPDSSFIVAVVQGLLEMEGAERARRAVVFRQVRKRIDRARTAYKDFLRKPARRRLYRCCLRQVAQTRGGIAAWLGYVGRWIGS